ncbi:MAG TPA: tetratricopeptide repeat protein [Gemmatimonadaceae bacterium]|nr:tetratricopeptide repeat protein [Gemmatimonadaceae bacterium]
MSRYAKGILHIAVSLAFVLIAASAQAQRGLPDRPRLPDGEDRNDPWAYYRLANSSLRRDPDKAADAFFWAARLNPTWAEAYYGRRVALLLRDRPKLVRYYEGDEGVIRETQGIDSLYLYALTLNPFLGPQLDHLILDAMIQEYSRQAANRSGESPSDIAYQIEAYLRQSPRWRAILAYRDGKNINALSLYAQAIPRSKDKGGIIAERGRLFFQMGQYDSAFANVTEALAELRKADKKDLVFLYESKALMESRIAMIEQVKGNKAAAAEAFGRALQEDLSYFPAHVNLAYLALEAGDAETVVSEMNLAVDIRPDDPGIRYRYGYALGTVSKLEEAEVQLKKAVELDPDYAAPHFTLGEVYQAGGRKPEAIKAYETFLALSAANDVRRPEANDVLALLKAAK